jgi:hypothetical protein
MACKKLESLDMGDRELNKHAAMSHKGYHSDIHSTRYNSIGQISLIFIAIRIYSMNPPPTCVSSSSPFTSLLDEIGIV